MRFNEFQSPKIPYKDPSASAKNTIWIPPRGIHVGVTGYEPFITATGSNWPMTTGTYDHQVQSSRDDRPTSSKLVRADIAVSAKSEISWNILKKHPTMIFLFLLIYVIFLLSTVIYIYICIPTLSKNFIPLACDLLNMVGISIPNRGLLAMPLCPYWGWCKTTCICQMGWFLRRVDIVGFSTLYPEIPMFFVLVT